MNKEITICQNKGKSKYCMGEFTITPDDFTFYEKMKVPPPTFCPTCRMQRRIASRNQRSLFNRPCSKCKEITPSVFHKDSPYIVYCTKCFFKDDWDAGEFFADYDFTKPFFLQFKELREKVPQIHLSHTNNNGEGIVFSNYVYRSSNVYLSCGVVRSENIFYSWGSENGNKMCIDSANFSNNENCYELVSAQQNYNCSFLTRSSKCLDSHFLFDCNNCSHCFMSSNLRNKSYVFRNKQLTKEAYLEALVKENKDIYENQLRLENEYKICMENAIHRYASIIGSLNCTGNFIFNSKNIFKSFSVEESENSSYGQITTNSISNCMDFSMTGRAEDCYEFAVAGRGNLRAKFCLDIGGGVDISYCDWVEHGQDLFGCVGLRNKKYCILNKQYTKEEYFVLKEKIIEHMNSMPYIDSLGRIYKYGEYFPIELSRFAYNQTQLFDLFPLSKIEAINEGYKWFDQSKRTHMPSVTFESLPLSIKEINLSHLKHVYPCLHDQQCNHICVGAFTITEVELELYKKLNLALPRLCPNCRYFKRIERILPWRLWSRTCMNQNSPAYNGPCQNIFETSYAPDRLEKVYCEDCYKREVL